MVPAILLLVVLGAATKLGVSADQADTRLQVQAKVVTFCRISTPGRVSENAVQAATDSVRVRCGEPTIWKIAIDRGATRATAPATIDALRVTIHF
jgi:spore coat protein U-like protein